MALPAAVDTHPRLVRHANRLLPRLWQSRLLPQPDLLEATIEGQAKRSTGLSDFGDPWFRAPLRRLLPALCDEADLNPLGRVIAHGSLLKAMKERLWAEALFKAHPEIRARALPAPVVIVGPMRSGTTRLQRLLAADPRFVHLRLFEAMCPTPWPSSRPSGRDPRLTYTARGWKLLTWINPANAEVHPTGPLEPDEELGLLEQSFWGAQIEAQRRVPSYARWCEAEDATPAYRHMADLLRLTGWFRGDDPGRPWLLKTPQHMQDLAALDRLFPDSRLIFTHRDPVKVVGSACSLAWNQMVVQSDRVDPCWIGGEWLHKTEHRVRTTLDVRERIDPRRQIDVGFVEMNADWRGAMRRIYDFLDLELTPGVLAAMEAYLTRAERDQPFRQHRYSLEDFGLDARDVAERFAPYTTRFEIPAERR